MSFFMKPKHKALKKVAFVAAGLFIASTVIGAGAGALGFLDGGQQQIDMDAVDQQIDELRAEVESDPEDIMALRNLGNTKMQAGVALEQEENQDEAMDYYEMALDTFEDAYELDDSDLELKVDKASAAYSIQEFDRAEELLDDVLEEEPEHQQALNMSASLAYVDMDFDTAIDKWKEIINIHDLTAEQEEQYEMLISQAEEMKVMEEMDPKEEWDKEEWEEEFEEKYMDEKESKDGEEKEKDNDNDNDNDEQ